MHVCNFCKKEYSSKGILETHQKTAKFCLRLHSDLNIINNNFNCEFCTCNFSRKDHLERHYENCKIRLKKIKEENEQKKDLIILKLNEEINKYNDEVNNYKAELIIKDKQLKEVNNYKAELINKDKKLKIEVYNYEEELKIKDEIIQKLKKEIKILSQINSMSKNFNDNVENVQNITIYNYDITPITDSSVIGSFES
jgi:chromosome segregation ATPase